MNNISVPFRIKDVFEGFAESYGILRLNDDGLTVEFQTKDSIVGAIKSDVESVEVPVSDIEELDFKKGVFGNKLTIRLSRIGDTAKIPNQDPGEIRVSIDKKHVEAALSFVSAVKLEVVDRRIKELERK